MHANRVVTVVDRRWRSVIVAAVVSTVVLAANLSQAKEIVIHNQNGNTGSPLSVLVADSYGVLYGTAWENGGSVFSLTPPANGETNWTETILHEFKNSRDGSDPLAGLTPDGHGGFFGTTAYGGGNPSCGCGTVFHLKPPAHGETKWTETILYRFQGGSDAAFPFSRLLLHAGTGVLYGTTFEGGPWSAGTVFALAPPAPGKTSWTETVLYAFTGDLDGGFPAAYVIADTSGALYSTTTAGGFDGSGVVFKLSPPGAGQTQWSETALYSFAGYGFCDGATPDAGLVPDESGNLYSTTIAGGGGPGCYDGGTVFELSPPSNGGTTWTETILYAFTGQKDGQAAFSDILIDGNGAIYGTTNAGGTKNQGTVFKLTPPGAGQTAWTEKVLYSFKGSPDGADPGSGLTVGKIGNEVVLFGDTTGGGDAGSGTVYEITGSGFVP